MGARNGYVVRAGYSPSGDDNNRFQSEAIHESGAAVLIHPVLVLAGVCTIKSRQIYGQA